MGSLHQLAKIFGATLAAILCVSLLSAPAQAAARPSTPNRFTGYAFDTCVAPANNTMDAWNLSSPYAVVGIYTSGNSRYCDEDKQPYLSPAWVRRQAAKGWRFLPIHVGYQAPCFASNSKNKMSYDVQVARRQGNADANEATKQAAHYGFAKKNAVYLDIEWYPRSNSKCDRSVLAFIDAFVARAHKNGYKVGLYSSASAAITSVDALRHGGNTTYNYPDQMWFAWTNQKANTDGRPYLQNTYWRADRLHQYHNNVAVSFAGHNINIDKNMLKVGGGSKAPKEQKACGKSATLKRYRTMKPGRIGDDVRLLQCLLRRAGHKTKVTGRWNHSTSRSLKAYRASKGWSKKPQGGKQVWTSLLSQGSAPLVLKRGRAGDSVYRLQRSLRAAGQRVDVTGVYDFRTAAAVQAYRKRFGLPGYQTADRKVWDLLQRGRA